MNRDWWLSVKYPIAANSYSFPPPPSYQPRRGFCASSNISKCYFYVTKSAEVDSYLCSSLYFFNNHSFFQHIIYYPLLFCQYLYLLIFLNSQLDRKHSIKIYITIVSLIFFASTFIFRSKFFVALYKLSDIHCKSI